MWDKIYEFFEQYAGVSYNFTEDIEELKQNQFIEPYDWQAGIQTILDNLQEALDCIGRTLGEDMPTKDELKKIVASYVLNELMVILDQMKKTLCIEPTEISNFDALELQLFAMGQLIEMCTTNSLDAIMADDMFNTYTVDDEDEDDNLFVTVLGLNEKDIANIFMTIQSIRDDYYASLDEENE